MITCNATVARTQDKIHRFLSDLIRPDGGAHLVLRWGPNRRFLYRHSTVITVPREYPLSTTPLSTLLSTALSIHAADRRMPATVRFQDELCALNDYLPAILIIGRLYRFTTIML
jgi:hypothetical protein